jgi:hypothetical protein
MGPPWPIIGIAFFNTVSLSEGLIKIVQLLRQKRHVLVASIQATEIQSASTTDKTRTYRHYNFSSIFPQ